jgi:hypothetical protein
MMTIMYLSWTPVEETRTTLGLPQNFVVIMVVRYRENILLMLGAYIVPSNSLAENGWPVTFG